jgi:hypothetical protein
MSPPVRLRSGQAFGRHDRATQYGNISHLVANEVEAFAGQRGGSLAVPRKAQLLEVSGQALNRPRAVR